MDNSGKRLSIKVEMDTTEFDKQYEIIKAKLLELIELKNKLENLKG